MTSPIRRAGRRPLRALLSTLAVVSVAAAGMSASVTPASATTSQDPVVILTPTFPSAPSGPATTTTTKYSSTSGTQKIPDGTSEAVGMPIQVTADHPIAGMAVTVTLAHGCTKDLRATIYAPATDTFATLFGYGQGTCDNGEGVIYTFVDDASKAPGRLGQFASPSNVYIPNDSFATSFSGLSTTVGTWYLNVSDNTAGHPGSINAASITFDNPTSTPPSVTIDSGPDDETVDVPTFTFSSDSDNADGFECLVTNNIWSRSSSSVSMDDYQPCTSPLTLYLDNGYYQFAVRAVDADGNAGDAQYRYFGIERSASEPDAGGPSVTITSGPAEGATIEGDPTFGFTTPADDFAGYECTVDGAFVPSCTNPYTITGLAPGQHSFGVRGVDADGNRGTLTVRTFTIATPAPSQACTDAQAAYDTAVAQVTSLKQQIKDAKAAGQKKKVKKLKAKLAQAKADRSAAQAQVDADC